jgi:hypothetical protein
MVGSWWPAALLRATRQANGHTLFTQGYEIGRLYSWQWRQASAWPIQHATGTLLITKWLAPDPSCTTLAKKRNALEREGWAGKVGLDS